MGRDKSLLYAVTLILVFTLSLVGVSAQNHTNLTFISGSVANLLDNSQGVIEKLLYDRMTGTQGSASFMDSSPVNPNANVLICHDDLTTDMFLDVVYYSESQNLTASVLNFLPRITQVDSQTNCSLVDVDLASTKTLYPGYLAARLIDENDSTIYELALMDTLLNGSYNIQISVDGPTETYFIGVNEVFDEFDEPITTISDRLIVSFVNSTGSSVVEGKLRPQQSIIYDGIFRGGETVFVNALKSLEIITIDACSSINESGYYLINSSAWNVNDSCLSVENQSGVTVNFADQIIDGDNSINGSKDPIRKPCAITIRDSQEVTIEGLKVQEFYYGICIENSDVTILRDDSVVNVHGIRSVNSTVFARDIFLDNEDTNIQAFNNSRISLLNTQLSNATIKTDFKDMLLKPVFIKPPGPPIEGYEDIGQFVDAEPTSVNDSWMQLSFYYDEELPNRVVMDNLSIFRYNGTYEVTTTPVFNNVTNTTTNVTQADWVGGDWLEIFTLISPSEQLIMSPNMTQFSIFAPFGEPTNFTDPEPEPEPTPRPDPQSGDSPGAGGTPGPPVDSDVIATPEAIRLELELPSQTTLQQGQAGEIQFNVTNIGDVSAPNLVIIPRAPAGWDFTNNTVGTLGPGLNVTDTFQLAPFERATPRDYEIIVEGRVSDGQGGWTTAVAEVMTVTVIPRQDLRRIRVLEYPPIVTMQPNSQTDIAFLVENIGEFNINNIVVDPQTSADCLIGVQGEDNVQRRQRKTITYTFLSSSELGRCNVNVRFLSDDELVGFAPMIIEIEPATFFTTDNTLKQILFLLILIAWSAYTARVYYKKRG